MIEKALKGNRTYWIWIISLLSVIAFGISAYVQQMRLGLSVTGLGGNACWGISAMHFIVMAGFAASTVPVVLSVYLHDNRSFGKIMVIAQFLGVSAAVTSLLFLLIDMGKPQLMFDLLRYPNLRSFYSWAFFLLSGYIFVNLTSSWATLGAERKGVAAAGWIKPLLLFVSVPLAMTIPVVAGLAYTAFPANLWFVSLLAPRLLLSSFAGSTALLLLTILVLKRTTAFDAGKDLVSKLSTFVVYAASLHFLLQSMSQAMPLIWLSLVCGIASITILLMPQLKSSTSWLAVAAAGILFAIWLEKGAVLLYSPTGGIDAGYYTPAFAEISMTLGLCSLGMLLLTILLKVAVAIKMTK